MQTQPGFKIALHNEVKRVTPATLDETLADKLNEKATKLMQRIRRSRKPETIQTLRVELWQVNEKLMLL